jgi:hypothetical protein
VKPYKDMTDEELRDAKESAIRKRKDKSATPVDVWSAMSEISRCNHEITKRRRYRALFDAKAEGKEA